MKHASIENAALRLPHLTDGLSLQMLTLEVGRDNSGMRWCRDRSVGSLRRKLGHTMPVFNVSGENAVEIMRDRLRVLLGLTCEQCPFKSCKMKEW